MHGANVGDEIMQKQKKNNDLIVIGIIALVLALFLGLNLGFAMYDMELLEQEQKEAFEGTEKFSKIAEFFEEELKEISIKNFRWNDTVKKPVLVAFFVWFLAIAYYYSERKNFITGKEYGTARWGTQNDIRELFAENVMQKDIQKAKRLKNPLGRYMVKKEIRQRCKKYANEYKKQEITKAKAEYERELKLLEQKK